MLSLHTSHVARQAGPNYLQFQYWEGTTKSILYFALGGMLFHPRVKVSAWSIQEPIDIHEWTEALWELRSLPTQHNVSTQTRTSWSGVGGTNHDATMLHRHYSHLGTIQTANSAPVVSILEIFDCSWNLMTQQSPSWNMHEFPNNNVN